MTYCQTLLTDLRKKGYRITPQRELIIQTIAHAGNHMTAEDIFAEVQTHTQALNLATIYRTLELLIDEGLVTGINLGEGRIVYATINHGPHIHLVCRGCGHVIDANPQLLASVKDQLQNEHSFQPDLDHISIFGLCANCR
jgi:Fur family ferric uptake transcriptional regulator